MNEQILEKYQSLKSVINNYESAVVAFSGGIDSSLVAYVAGEVLGNNALAVTSGSASLKRSDLHLAETLGKDWDLSHEIIVTDELSKADYRRNPVDRCFHCKTSLYTSLDTICKERASRLFSMAQTWMIWEITDQDLSRQTTIKSARL